MNKMFYERLLANFNRANSSRKEKLFKEAGYSSSEEYKEALLFQISNSVNVEVEKPTIHNVHILDRSGSMRGQKLGNALEGINSEISELKKDSNVIYLQSFIHFGNDMSTEKWRVGIQDVGHLHVNANGMTALNSTIGKVLEDILETRVGEEKTLVKIFTDGGENASRDKYRDNIVLSKLIKSAESKGVTVTFVGTEDDVQNVIEKLNIHKSNTISHNNTPEDIMRSFAETTEATMAYSKAVLDGEDVTAEFYSKTTGTL